VSTLSGENEGDEAQLPQTAKVGVSQMRASADAKTEAPKTVVNNQ
jgi:hypothetical protein